MDGNGASYGGFSPTIGFPSVRRPNGTCKVFGNSFIIAYLGQTRRASSAWGSVRIKQEMLTKLWTRHKSELYMSI